MKNRAKGVCSKKGIASMVTALFLTICMCSTGFAMDFRAPAAWALELGYTVELAGKETTFALGYQASEDAVEIKRSHRIHTLL